MKPEDAHSALGRLQSYFHRAEERMSRVSQALALQVAEVEKHQKDALALQEALTKKGTDVAAEVGNLSVDGVIDVVDALRNFRETLASVLGEMASAQAVVQRLISEGVEPV